MSSVLRVCLSLLLLDASEAYLLSPAPLPVSHHGVAAPLVVPRAFAPPLMRDPTIAAAEEEEDAALDAKLEADAAVARSAESLAAYREAGAKRAAALGADAAVAKALDKGGPAPTGKMVKLLKNPKGTIALIGEGVKIEALSLGGYDLDDPAYISREFRVGNCAAVCVTVTERDALKPDALEATAEEQETARGDFPGPLPLLVRDDFVEPAQLAAVAAAGGKMPLLSVALAGAEGIGELIAESERLGLEPIARVADEAELEAAIAAGAKMVCVGDVSAAQAEALLPKVPEGVVTIADFLARDVRGVWKVRDMGFNAIIIGAGMLDVCVRDRVPPTAVLKAMSSKARPPRRHHAALRHASPQPRPPEVGRPAPRPPRRTSASLRAPAALMSLALALRVLESTASRPPPLARRGASSLASGCKRAASRGPRRTWAPWRCEAAIWPRGAR